MKKSKLCILIKVTYIKTPIENSIYELSLFERDAWVMRLPVPGNK